MTYKEERIVDITPDVKWIGVLDYDIRTFDIVMTTEYGTTYNSFFINADIKAVVDVAKEKFYDAYLSKLRSVTDPADIKYIILNHTEPDHSGSLSRILEIAPSATVVGSGNAIRYLEDILNKPFKSMVVKDNDTIDLGNKTLRFISVPNLHWPDSMYTYLEEDKVLFTCDSFGAHYCTDDIFSDGSEAYLSAFRYYFDVILKPYSKFMVNAIDKIKTLSLSAVCPGHGPVHKGNHKEMVSLSENLSRKYLEQIASKPVKRVLIAYVSAYGYTKAAAEYISVGILESGNFQVDIADIETISVHELESKIISADGILAGSPTINQNTLMPVYKLFALINPIRDKIKVGGAFGSYGWSGEAPKIILENFRHLKLRIFEETGSFKFAPGARKGTELIEFGKRFAQRVLEYCS